MHYSPQSRSRNISPWGRLLINTWKRLRLSYPGDAVCAAKYDSLLREHPTGQTSWSLGRIRRTTPLQCQTQKCSPKNILRRKKSNEKTKKKKRKKKTPTTLLSDFSETCIKTASWELESLLVSVHYMTALIVQRHLSPINWIFFSLVCSLRNGHLYCLMRLGKTDSQRSRY